MKKARSIGGEQRAKIRDDAGRAIVSAAIELFCTLGPAHTGIQAIAERAGVSRSIIYQHFPASEDLLGVCATQYWADRPLPDPTGWLDIADPAARMRHGLGELYGDYGCREGALWNFLRDRDDQPGLHSFGSVLVLHCGRMSDVLASPFVTEHALRGGHRARLGSVLGHAVDFLAWRSLRRQGLDDGEAIDLMIALARGVAAEGASAGLRS
jgi:AcrR family transcriptional regulator